MAKLVIEYKVVCGICHREVDFMIHDGLKTGDEIAIAPCVDCTQALFDKVRKECKDLLIKHVKQFGKGGLE